MKIKFIIFILIIIIGVGSIGLFANKKQPENSKDLSSFAECISNTGAKLYGTFWCSHCKSQKEMFGSAAKYLPYIECSSRDGLNQLQICKEKEITGYPTWIFGDGSRLSGELSLITLAEKTQCVLPE